MLDNYIVVSIVICLTALLSYSFKLCFNSKCDNINICCLKIHRKIEHEKKDVEQLLINVK